MDHGAQNRLCRKVFMVGPKEGQEFFAGDLSALLWYMSARFLRRKPSTLWLFNRICGAPISWIFNEAGVLLTNHLLVAMDI
jgi:hypothetical protein